MKKIILLAFILLVILARESTGGNSIKYLTEGSQAIWSPDGFLIAYVKEGEIRIMGQEGKRKRLLVSPSKKSKLSFFSSGEKLFYIKEGEEIWLIEIKNKKSRFLDKGNNPSWSSKRNQIVYEKEGGIWIMGEEGKKKECIVKKEEVDNFSPVWLPNGKAILFIQGGSIYKISLKTGNISCLIKKSYSRWFIKVIPFSDGKRLLGILSGDWKTDGGGDTALIINLDTKEEKELGEVNHSCRLSDGGKVLYIWKGEIWLTDIMDGEKKRLTSGYLDEHPCLSSDRTKLLFTSQRKDTNKDGVIDWRDKKQIYLLKLERR